MTELEKEKPEKVLLVVSEHSEPDTDNNNTTPRSFATTASTRTTRSSLVYCTTASSSSSSSSSESESETANDNSNKLWRQKRSVHHHHRRRRRPSSYVSTFHTYTRVISILTASVTGLLFLAIIAFFGFHAAFNPETAGAPESSRARTLSHPRKGGMQMLLSPKLLEKTLDDLNERVRVVVPPFEAEHEGAALGYTENTMDEHEGMEGRSLVVESRQDGKGNNYYDDAVDGDELLMHEGPADALSGGSDEDPFNGTNEVQPLLSESWCQVPDFVPLRSSLRRAPATQSPDQNPCKTKGSELSFPHSECCYQVVSEDPKNDQLQGPHFWKTLVCTPFDHLDKESWDTMETIPFVRINCKSSHLPWATAQKSTGFRAHVTLGSTAVRDKIQYWVDQPEPTPRPPSVVLLGLDGISRLLFHSKFHKTKQLLLQKLNFNEMKGYHGLGSKALDSLIPLLMGIRKRGLPEACNHHWRSPWDGCPFIWKEYGEHKYVTLYAEDIPDSFHTGGQAGFKNVPTDYYLRPILLEKYRFDGDNHCVENRTTAEYILEYGTNFIDKFRMFQTPFFAYMWLNLPAAQRGSDYQVVDQALYQFFSKVFASSKNQGKVDNTHWILLSDHGAQGGEDRKTMSGFVSHRLPLLLIRTPDERKKQDSSSLLNNINSLLTPYDVHETLKGLLPRSNNSKSDEHYSNKKQLSIDILKGKVSNRTCKEARIPLQWCTCSVEFPRESHDEPSHSQLARLVLENNLTAVALGTLNELVDVQREALLIKPSSRPQACPSLTFSRVLFLGQIPPVSASPGEDPVIVIGIQVQEREAQFELFLASNHTNANTNRTWEVILPVLRIDSISGHAYCVGLNKKIV